MKNYIFLFMMVWGAISCEKNQGQPSEIKQFEYGTSFGMCVGYCTNEMLLKSGTVVYSRSGHKNQVEPIKCTENLPDTSWDSYKKAVDLNGFFKLQEIIGCPDCADGGAEWIEIVLFSGKKYRVTFEYGNEPGELENVVIALREQHAKRMGCGEF